MKTNKEEQIQLAEESLLHVYNRFSLVLDKGDGVYLYDTDGKQYLDFAAGIAVMAFGYNGNKYFKGNINPVFRSTCAEGRCTRPESWYYHTCNRRSHKESWGSCIEHGAGGKGRLWICEK